MTDDNRSQGKSPAIALINPQLPNDVGLALQAAACFGFRQVWFSGTRVQLSGERLTREERSYKNVELRQFDSFLDRFDNDIVPIYAGLTEDHVVESLPSFVHPNKAVYVFGSENDSSAEFRKARSLCRKAVAIPTIYNVPQSAAMYMVLYDRMIKRAQQGLDIVVPLSVLLQQQALIDSHNDQWQILIR